MKGDKKTPAGTFEIENLYYRKDRLIKPSTKLKCVEIKKNMGWCDDIKSKNYNKLIIIKKKIKHEKLFRNDNKYDLLIPIKYNFKKRIARKRKLHFYSFNKKLQTYGRVCCITKKRFFNFT